MAAKPSPILPSIEQQDDASVEALEVGGIKNSSANQNLIISRSRITMRHHWELATVRHQVLETAIMRVSRPEKRGQESGSDKSSY